MKLFYGSFNQCLCSRPFLRGWLLLGWSVIEGSTVALALTLTLPLTLALTLILTLSLASSPNHGMLVKIACQYFKPIITAAITGTPELFGLDLPES